MKINILLPYKDKFDKNKASSVSITVKNNLIHSKYLDQIRVFGQKVENPLFKDNFTGFNHSILSFKSKNKYLAHEMLKKINKDIDKEQLIEIHNRPYLVDLITQKSSFPVSLFFHNDPQTMKGSKSVKDRKKILQKCTAIFCVSEFIKDKFSEGINENLQKVHILYNGVERKLKSFPIKKKEILFVGRLVPEKGVDLYVDVIQNIAKKFPDWTFDMIGSYRLGDNKEMGSFANQVIKKFLKIGSQAKFHGFQNQRFVEKKMESASVIIIPSIWQEPFGLVAAEAMSYGICIIASKVGGIPEIIKDNGILIENINKKNLQNNLLRVIQNVKLREDYQVKSWSNFNLTSKFSSNKLDRIRKTLIEMCF